jgi:hypothetical protein
VSEELPKQELLIKMLGMTTSDNDGQALVAIRKANAFLLANGWDWDRLIRGKITIVEDPFKSIPTPPRQAPEQRFQSRSTPQQPQPTQPTSPPRQTPPRPQPQPSRPTWQDSSTTSPNAAGPDYAGMVPIFGNTYPIKDKLKMMGGKWNSRLRVWYVPLGLEQDAVKLLAAANSPIGADLL